MNEHTLITAVSTLGCCVVGAIYPVVLAKQIMFTIAKDTQNAERGWTLCLTAGILFGAFVTLGTLA